MRAYCAWCGQYQGLRVPIQDQSITHGICAKCAKVLEAQVKARKPKSNPGHIPGNPLEIRYRRGRAGFYKHEFKPGVKQRRLHPGERFSHHQNAVVLYHPDRPVWEDDRTRGFWHKYGHGRGGSNPMARRSRGRGRGGFSGIRMDFTTVALLAGVGYLLYTWMATPAAAEETVSLGGGQAIVPQPAGTVWYSDPFNASPAGQVGDQSFFIGSLPPGSSPPWRLASEAEIAAMNLGLAAGTIVAAGGGMIVHA